MPIQMYFCQKCGITFEMSIPFHAKVPKTSRCPQGQHFAYWRPSAPAVITVKDGTGAGKGRR